MEKSYVLQMAALQSSHWWYEGRRRIIMSFMKRINLNKSKATILDAGCGPGSNLTSLATFGEVKAFEPDAYSCQHARDISGLTVNEGALPAPIPYDEYFDVVCAFDVIEHVEDDLGSLKALHAKLKPSGHALFTVPAHMWLWSEHDVNNHHYRRYTLQGFEALLKDAGFKIEKISYYNMWLFPLAAGVRLVKKLLHIKNTTETNMPPAFINKILCSIFASEALLLDKINLPFGLSVIAHCRKEDLTRNG